MVNVHANIITKEIGSHLRKHVAACLRLLDDGATVPFISRYRKEATGGMDEVTVYNIKKRHEALFELEKRKEYILQVISGQDALTPEIETRIEETFDPIVLEDIFLPYKPKRNTRAQTARALGLEPLAKMIMSQSAGASPESMAAKFVKGEVKDVSYALSGASDIIAEWVSESEKARNIVRSRYQRSAIISSKVIPGKESEGEKYQNYFDFSEPLRTCNSHRYLAIRRAEEEGILKVGLSIDDDDMMDRLNRMFVRATASPLVADIVKAAVKDGYRRLMRPSIENEIAAVTKEKSDTGAIQMFANNVQQLLMSPPLGRKRILAIDPGFRTGCKVVALDEQGNLLYHDVIYPTPPANDFVGAGDTLCYMVDRYRIDAIAVGTGTGGRETERFLRDVVFPRRVQIYMVNEQGASIYSASEVAREEFPDEDVTVRGAVSIGRRLLDPLAELVKIDPKSIGVGQYQHDMPEKRLSQALSGVVEDCVNAVGVDLNTASAPLLSRVSGLNAGTAENIVKYREENGAFTSRKQILKVPKLGAKAFEQCAGFLRVSESKEILDNTSVHPESYEAAKKLIEITGYTMDDVKKGNLGHLMERLNKYGEERAAKECGIGLLTLFDICKELKKPGRDPRDELPAPILRTDVLDIKDLAPGMELRGTVRNVIDFGAFVDIGVHQDGLVHISQICDKFIRHPSEVLSVGDVVTVWIKEVDEKKKRISLTMKKPQ